MALYVARVRGASLGQSGEGLPWPSDRQEAGHIRARSAVWGGFPRGADVCSDVFVPCAGFGGHRVFFAALALDCAIAVRAAVPAAVSVGGAWPLRVCREYV